MTIASPHDVVFGKRAPKQTAEEAALIAAFPRDKITILPPRFAAPVVGAEPIGPGEGPGDEPKSWRAVNEKSKAKGLSKMVGASVAARQAKAAVRIAQLVAKVRAQQPAPEPVEPCRHCDGTGKIDEDPVESLKRGLSHWKLVDCLWCHGTGGREDRGRAG